MELNPNIAQILIQLSIFLSLIFILKFFYFDPILALIHRRESLTVGRSGEAVQFREKADALRADYDTKILDARQSLDAERAALLKSAKDRLDSKIAEAKSALDKKLLAHSKEVQSEYHKLRTRLPELSMEVSKEIVSAITASRVVRL